MLKEQGFGDIHNQRRKMPDPLQYYYIIPPHYLIKASFLNKTEDNLKTMTSINFIGVEFLFKTNRAKSISFRKSMHFENSW